MDPAYYSNSHLAVFTLTTAGGLFVAIGWLLWDMNRVYPISMNYYESQHKNGRRIGPRRGLRQAAEWLVRHARNLLRWLTGAP